MIEHELEFQKPSGAKDVEKMARELALAYARVFLGSEDGKRVLADLRRKFGVQRLCFTRGEHGRLDYLAAAVTDGERRVMTEIESALQSGAPDQGL